MDVFRMIRKCHLLWSGTVASILFCRHTIIYIHVERVRIPILRHVEEMIDYSFCFVRNEDISIYEGVLRVLRM